MPLDVHILTFGGDTYNYNKNYTKLFIGDDDDDDDDDDSGEGGENGNANSIGECPNDVSDIECNE